MAVQEQQERWTPAGPIKGPLTMDVIEAEEGRTQATVGEPAPLGLVAFATGTFAVSTVLARWFPITTIGATTTALFIFAGIGQFIAGMWSYRKGDTLAATAFGSFGAFNTLFALLIWLQKAGLIAGPGGYGDGTFAIVLFCFSLIAAGLMAGAFYRNLALVGVLGWLSLAYGLDGLGYLVGRSAQILDYGGWAGIVSSLIAFYVAIAMVVNGEARHVVLPLGRPLAHATPPPTAPAPVALEQRERMRGDQM